MTQKITTPLAGWENTDAPQDGAVEQAMRALDAWSQAIGAGAESNPSRGYSAVPAVAAASQDWVMPWRDALLPDAASPGAGGIGGASQSGASGFTPAPFDLAADASPASTLSRSASSPPAIGGASSNQ
jgi:hypothetical protein